MNVFLTHVITQSEVITEVEVLQLHRDLNVTDGHVKLLYSESLDVLKFLTVFNVPSLETIRELFQLSSSTIDILEQIWKDGRHLLCNEDTLRRTDIVSNSEWLTRVEVGNKWCSNQITPVAFLQITSENSHNQKVCAELSFHRISHLDCYSMMCWNSK